MKRFTMFFQKIYINDKLLFLPFNITLILPFGNHEIKYFRKQHSLRNIFVPLTPGRND